MSDTMPCESLKITFSSTAVSSLFLLSSLSSPCSVISTLDNFRPVNVVRSLNIGSDLNIWKHSWTRPARLSSVALSYLLYIQMKMYIAQCVVLSCYTTHSAEPIVSFNRLQGNLLCRKTRNSASLSYFYPVRKNNNWPLRNGEGGEGRRTHPSPSFLPCLIVIMAIVQSRVVRNKGLQGVCFWQ